jgi:hypothetical protein
MGIRDTVRRGCAAPPWRAGGGSPLGPGCNKPLSNPRRTTRGPRSGDPFCFCCNFSCFLGFLLLLLRPAPPFLLISALVPPSPAPRPQRPQRHPEQQQIRGASLLNPNRSRAAPGISKVSVSHMPIRTTSHLRTASATARFALAMTQRDLAPQTMGPVLHTFTE